MTNEEAMKVEQALDSAKSAHRRINEIADQVADLQQLTQAVAVTANNVERMQKDMSDLKDDVKLLITAPGKWWEKVVGYALSAVVGGIISYIIANVIK